MQIQERTYSPDSNSYRFGFNSKEQDSELSGQGNVYDYGFRIYQSRLGKFLSVDPLFKSYPWYTPYQFAGNMPLVAMDLDGLEEWIIHYKRDKKSGELILTNRTKGITDRPVNFTITQTDNSIVLVKFENVSKGTITLWDHGIVHYTYKDNDGTFYKVSAHFNTAHYHEVDDQNLEKLKTMEDSYLSYYSENKVSKLRQWWLTKKNAPEFELNRRRTRKANNYDREWDKKYDADAVRDASIRINTGLNLLNETVDFTGNGSDQGLINDTSFESDKTVIDIKKADDSIDHWYLIYDNPDTNLRRYTIKRHPSYSGGESESRTITSDTTIGK